MVAVSNLVKLCTLRVLIFGSPLYVPIYCTPYELCEDLKSTNSDSTLNGTSAYLETQNYRVPPTLGNLPFYLYFRSGEIKEARISSISPASGLVNGGTTIIVAGVGFVKRDLKCRFGSEEMRARYIAPTLVECKTPPRPAYVGIVPFSMISKEFGECYTTIPSTTNESLTFQYYEDAVIQSVFPTKGMIGSTVTVKGENFVPAETISCVFGGVVVPAKHKTGNEVTCVVPPYNLKKRVPISVSINGVDFRLSDVSFEYILSPPQIYSIQPSMGTTSGGTSLTVSGVGFLNTSHLDCLFGEIDIVAGVFVSDNKIVCNTPKSQQPATVSVVIRFQELDYVTNRAIFRFIVDPQITAIQPNIGPISGNTLVIFHGHNFIDSDIIKCRFGELNTTGRFISAEKLECRSPSQKAGRLPVYLTFNGFEYYHSVDKYEYHNPITITSFSPKSSLYSGGTNITVVGYNFIDSYTLKCRFDRVVVPAIFHNANAISCSTPAGLTGDNIQVTASNNGVDFCNPSRNPFKYYSTPRVTSISPKMALSSKSSFVSVFGFGFYSEVDLSCAFGDLISVPATYISNTELNCTLPPIAFVGVIVVEISLNNRDYTSDGMQFELINEPQISSIWPNRGPVNGHTKVTVVGDYFVDRLGITCHFGPVAVQGSILSSDKAECNVAAVVSSGKVKFWVSVADRMFPSNEVVFYYTPSASASSLSPRRWAVSFTGLVLVTGKGFYLEYGCPWTCKFGDIFTIGEFVSPDTLACRPPTGILRNATFSLLYPCSHCNVETGIVVNTVDPLVLKSLWPMSSPSIASSPLTIELIGIKMEERYVCTFDEISVNGTILNATHLSCNIPKGVPARTIRLSVNYADFDPQYAVRRDFLIHQLPSITHVIPSVSPWSSKETVVKVVGKGFLNSHHVTCRFGEWAVNGRSISSTEVECQRPILRPGHYVVEVSINAVDFTTDQIIHEVLPELEIFDLYPKEAALNGGVSVTVFGLGFHSSLDLSCSFGDTLTIATVLGKDKLTCLTPTRSKGATLPFKLCDHSMFCVETAAFSFVEQVHSTKSIHSSRIMISNYSSSIVSDCEEAEIFLVGDNFHYSKQLVCYFSLAEISAKVTADWFSSHIIRCKIPELQAGPYSFHLENELEHSSSALDISVVSCPTIIEIFPSWGELTGGTLITVTGKNFMATDVYCRFGNRQVKAHEIVGSSIVRCRSTPGDKAGPVQVTLSFHEAAIISSGIQFQYTDPLSIHSVSPEVVGQYYPNTLVIHGTGFDGFDRKHIACEVGRSTSFMVTTDERFSHLTCHFDELPEAGVYPLRILDHGNVVLTKPEAVYVVPRPLISNVSPNWALNSEMGKNVIVDGTLFVNTKNLSCFFGDKIQHAFFLSSTRVQCMVPDVAPGILRLRISNDGKHSSESSLTFHFLHPISMIAVTPSHGWAGTAVTIRGKGFFDGLYCGFSTSHSAATVLNENELQCTAPQLSWLLQVPVVPIYLFFDGVMLLPEVSHFFEFVQLDVERVFPKMGSTRGGTLVTLHLRRGNAEEVTRCRFGNSITVALRNSVSEVTCYSPKTLKTGLMPLSLSLNGTDFAPIGFFFSYVEDPKVYSIYPDSGSWRGGTVVTFFGSNFQEDMRLGCKFGDRFAIGSRISSSLFFCSTPELSLGPQQVFITVNSVDFFSVDKIFESVEDIILSEEMSPDSSPVNCEVNVTIRGKNFRSTGQLSCRFDDRKVPALFISSSEVICLAPAEITAKHVQVAVSINGYDYYACPMLFHYHPVIDLHSFFPLGGPIGTQTSVSLSGSNFLSGPSAFHCIFGELVREAVIVSDAILVCDSPPSTFIGSVKLAISFPGIILSAKEFFTYHPTIEIFALFPTFGYFGLQQTVSVYGSQYSAGTDLWCKIDGVKRLAIFVSTTEVKCLINATQHTGAINVSISSNGQSFAENTLVYEITEKAYVRDLRLTSLNNEKGIIIIGSNFLPFDGLSCQLSRHYFSAPTFINQSHIECDLSYKQIVADISFEGLFLDGKLMHDSYQVTIQEWVGGDPLEFSPQFASTVGGASVRIRMKTSNSIAVNYCVFGESIAAPALSDSFPIQETACIVPPALHTGDVVLDFSLNDPYLKPSGVSFKYIENPVVESMFPDSGPSAGRSVITVRGTNFAKFMNLGCKFSDIFVPGKWESNSRISCVSPSLPAGFHKLVITGDVPVVFNTFLFFVYIDFPFCEEPCGISANSEIVLSGKDFSFSTGISCVFGGYIVPARFVSDSKIGCTPPPYLSTHFTDFASPKELTLQISINGQDFSPGKVQYALAPLPTITGIFPSKGIVGTHVTVLGKHFGENFRGSFCRFGSLVVSARIVSDATLTCTSPPSKDSRVALQVSVNDGIDWSSMGSAYFEYYTEARVDKVVPSDGVYKGGTPVAIYGVNFINSSFLTCSFGGKRGTRVVWISSSQINCVTPAFYKPRAVHVQISNNGVNFSTESVVFTYHGYAQITSIFPSFGFPGTVVVVSGKNFLLGAKCKFGIWTSNATYISSGKVECTAPSVSHASSVSQALEVYISNNGLDFSPRTHSCIFTYIKSPVVYYINPTETFSMGGDELNIHGANLNSTGIAWCLFIPYDHTISASNVVSQQARVISDSFITCLIPKQKCTARMEVRVSINSVNDRSVMGGVYTYRRVPRIVDIIPKYGSVKGGTFISVLGHGFPDMATECFFGSTKVPGFRLTPTRLQCVIPPANSLDYQVLLSVYIGGILIHSGVRFHYLLIPLTPTFLAESLLPGYANDTAQGESAPLSSRAFYWLELSFTIGENRVLNPLFSSAAKVATGNQLRSNNEIHNTMSTMQSLVSSQGFNIHSFSSDQGRLDAHNRLRAKPLCTPICNTSEIESSCIKKAIPDMSGQFFNVESKQGLRFFAVSPTFGPDVGNSTIWVKGNSFDEASRLFCRFGATLTEAMFHSTRELSCKTPMMPPGKVEFSLSVNNKFYFLSGLLFLFYKPVHVTEISPGIGSSGTGVKIYCSELFPVPAAVCRFGTITVSASFSDEANVAFCVAPVLGTERSVVNVTFSLNGHDFHGGASGSVITFTYLQDPVIISLSPSFGWKKGGTEIFARLDRTYSYPHSPLYCVFGSGDFVLTSWKAADYVACLTPPMREDVSVVSVYISYDPMSTIGVKMGATFTYVDAVVINKVSPAWGSVIGGTRLDVYGENFRNVFDLRCVISDFITVAEFVSNKHVKCVTPMSHNVGEVVTVEVFSQSGSVKTYHSEAKFQYHSNPTVSFIEPLYGTIEGGASVSIYGNGFKKKFSLYMQCRFGENTLPVQATYVNESKIICVSPSAAETVSVGESVIVFVSLNGRDFVMGDESVFTYLSGIHVLSVEPMLGSVSGGTLLTVKASKSPILSKGRGNSIFCVFKADDWCGTTPAIIPDDEGVLFCRSPPSRKTVYHPTVLSLRFNGNETTLTGTRFSYYSGPEIHNFSPTIGVYSGGEHVEISGEGFLDVELLGCIFGTVVSPAATWILPSKILCLTPPVNSSSLAAENVGASLVVGVTVNGVDYVYAKKKFHYVPNPIVSFMSPKSENGSDYFVLYGSYLERATACRWGIFGASMPVHSKSKTSIVCLSPKSLPFSPYLDKDTRLYLSYGYHFVDMNVSMFDKLGLGRDLKSNQAIHSTELHEKRIYMSNIHPVIHFANPNYISSFGGEWIAVHGANFSSLLGTGCLFGTSNFIDGQVGSSAILYCKTFSHPPGVITLQVVNGASNLHSNSLNITVYADSSVLSINPEIGSRRGGTPVTIGGIFHAESDIFQFHPESVLCRFGSFDVRAINVTITEMICLSPPNSIALTPETVKVSVSFNSGKSFSRSFVWYRYVNDAEVHYLTPSFGPISGGTKVQVEGDNFQNSTNLKCKFGSLPVVDGRYISRTCLTCISPSANTSRFAKVEISNNGVDFSHSETFFEYHNAVKITSAWPLMGPESGGTFVTIQGSGFIKSLEMFCFFGEIKVIAIYWSSETISCKSPPGTAGALPLRTMMGDVEYHPILCDSLTCPEEISFLYMQIPTLHAIYPNRGKVEGGSMVFITGSFFVHTAYLKCQFGEITVKARLANSNTMICTTPPSKSMSSSMVAVKISLNGLDFPIDGPTVNFLFEQKCGKGYICGPSASSFGYKSPNGTYAPQERNVNFTLCEPGFFQPISGQADCIACPVPLICPDFGLHQPILCPAGFVCDKVGLSSPSQRCPRGHYCLAGTGANHIIDPLSESNLTRYDHLNEAKFLLSPFPCPIGYYCRDGVSSITPIPGNFSTPQKCFKGYICPPGSFSPEGSGPCPSGYYCPTATLMVECPKGYFCPAIGNTKPTACDPGTYNFKVGQSRCTPCGKGNVCAGKGRITPDICPPGYVCDVVGLALPDKLCPSGFYCEAGTETIDPDDPQLKGPRPCPAGAFCLGGVAHNKSIDWLPLLEDAKTAPQRCLEGYFCDLGSSLPTGSGSCMPGHYCPPESAFPVAVPLGTFSSAYGSIAPSLCFPGTFTPINSSVFCRLCPSGSSCINYATYIPRRCDPGTYRSMEDGTSCIPCPTGTFTPFSGANDVTECLPCPEGRVCGKKGMNNVSESDPCEEGHMCGLQTNRNYQSNHLAAAGFLACKGSKIKEQFSFPCPLGYVCSRGSASRGKSQSFCPIKAFCSDATPRASSHASRCPIMTLSYAGSSELQSCLISPISICDKSKEMPNNPFEDATYYATDSRFVNSTYGLGDPGKSGGIGGADVKHSKVMVSQKIIPISLESIHQLWKNDTVDVIRSCPSYGFLEDRQSITILGRNFRNSSSLTCRFTFCDNIDVQKIDECRIKTVTHQKATFISTSRLSCPIPEQQPSTVKGTSIVNQTNICSRDPDGAIFYFQQCTKGEYLANKCDQLRTLYIWAYRKVYSLVIPCTVDSIDENTCDNIPESGMRINPCFSSQAFVEISNNGKKFSGDLHFVPSSKGLEDGLVHKAFSSYIVHGTFAKYTFLDQALVRDLQIKSIDKAKTRVEAGFLHAIEMDESRCMTRWYHEEGERGRENGWFSLHFMHVARLSLDWRQIPEELHYDKHFKLAIFARPSRCMINACDKGAITAETESYPCNQPIELPEWFVNGNVNKHQIINLTINALDDVLFKVEIHLIHGLYISSFDFFAGTMKVNIAGPSRAYMEESTKHETAYLALRRLSPFVSYEETLVEKEYIFGIRYSEENAILVKPPLNLPPRWKQLGKGRVLVGMNATHGSIPVVKGSHNHFVSDRFWENPFDSPSDAKVESDAFLETFHGVFRKTTGEYDYNLDQVILSYLPFFSNCFEYDSYIPFWLLVEDSKCALPEVSPNYGNDWWRREYPPLPKQEVVRPIGPLDLTTFNPVADWCERMIHCTYEENLKQPDRLPRWFEAETGVNLFSFIRDPIDYHQYSGRQSGHPEPDDGGGTQYLKTISSPDTFIPVVINRDAASYVEGGCEDLCFPRRMRLEVLYHQLSSSRKRIVESSLTMEDFDKNGTRDDYVLHVSFRPLDYKELVDKFVFGLEIFLLLFCTIGAFTVLVASLFWLVVNYSTRLESPPKLNFYRMATLIIPNACYGFFLGLVPISIATFLMFLVFKGHVFSASRFIFEADGMSLLDSVIPIHFAYDKVEPNDVVFGSSGRMGVAFLSLAVIIIYEGSKLFVPRVFSRIEKEFEESIRQKAGKFAWMPHTWKRTNFICSSLFMGVLLVLLVEFSFWKKFGDHIWLFLFGLQVIGILASDAVKAQVGEELLQAPLLMSLGLVQGVMTLSSNDFMDFLTSYIVGFGFMLLQRMYINPFKSTFCKWLIFMFRVYRRKLTSWVSFSYFCENQDTSTQPNIRIRTLEDSEGNGKVDTVEPIIEMYSDYSSDILSVFCTPCIIFMLIIFRKETEIADMYGIKESDMKHYLSFSIIIIPFQITADIFIHGSLELFHGWKIQEYLMFCKYRFHQREYAWRGFERNTLDECIEEDLRTIDHLCFSGQYYMILFLHTAGIIYFVLGSEMIIRSEYNPFGDPATLLIVSCVFLASGIVKFSLLWIALKINVWKPRSSNIKWLVDTRNAMERVEPIDFSSRKYSFSMEKRMMEDSFRFRFIDHNRNWLLSQLPNILTPRTVKRSRPYLLNQFAKILTSLNDEISSDSETDDVSPRFEATDGILNGTSRGMMKSWLYRAKRRVVMKRITEPLIVKERGSYCEQCLSRRQLQVQVLVDFDFLESNFLEKYDDVDFVQATWKKFWCLHQKYQTLCLPCISSMKEKGRKARLALPSCLSGLSAPESLKDQVSIESNITSRSKQLLKKWHETAKENRLRIRHSNGGVVHRPRITSSTYSSPIMSASSKDCAIRWLLEARNNLHRK